MVSTWSGRFRLVLLLSATLLAPPWPGKTACAQALADSLDRPSHTESVHDAGDVLKRANRATVRIDATRRTSKGMQYSSGAGVVLSSDGYVVTAHHVVRDYNDVRITSVSGKPLLAKVVSVDEDFDIAVVKVDQSADLEPASIASPERIRSGRRTLVIGNPLGGGQKAIAGKLGPTRTVTWDGKRAELRMIQAAVVPGDSGGGAFDLDTGELLGITVAKSSTQDDTGYVVPADRIVATLSTKLPILEIADTAAIDRSLGVYVRPVRLVAGRFPTGLLITHVDDRGLAARAGWREGQILVGLDKYRTTCRSDMLYALQKQQLSDSSSAVSFLLAAPDGMREGRLSADPFPAPPTASLYASR